MRGRGEVQVGGVRWDGQKGGRPVVAAGRHGSGLRRRWGLDGSENGMPRIVEHACEPFPETASCELPDPLRTMPGQHERWMPIPRRRRRTAR